MKEKEKKKTFYCLLENFCAYQDSGNICVYELSRLNV